PDAGANGQIPRAGPHCGCGSPGRLGPGGDPAAWYHSRMCGRYTLRRIDATRLGVAYPQPPFEEFTARPRFNVAPSQRVPVVRAAADGERELALAAWGFVP